MERAADLTFSQLLDGARSGCPSALGRLVRSVERSLVVFLSARGAEDPEGLANDVLFQVCRHAGGFSGGEAQFRAWVFTIARNRLVDERRRTSRRPVQQATPPHQLPEGPWEHDDERCQREGVAAMLTSLTDEQREVVLLRIVGGLTVEETAAVVGRGSGAVRALQHRAVRRLRKNLSVTRNGMAIPGVPPPEMRRSRPEPGSTDPLISEGNEPR